MIKEQIQRILNANGESWFGFIILCALTSMLLLAVFSIVSDHEIRCYYMKADSSNSVVSYKVMGDIVWADDVTVFIGYSTNDSLKVMSNLVNCASK